MAVPAVEVHDFRSEVTRFSDSMRSVDMLLARVEDFGANDAERSAFFEAAFGPDTDNPDLDWSTFATGIVALRAMRTAWQAQRLAIVKLRR